MKRNTRIISISVLLLAILLPFFLAKWQQKQFRNFRVVKNGVLYRSGQMTLAGIKKIAHDYQIKTIISLRDSYESLKPPPDREEEEFARAEGITFIRLSPKKWESDTGDPPVMENVHLFVDTMKNPKALPVIVHCFAGIHRTGSYCAIYRMEFEGWTNTRALEELKKLGYQSLENEADVYGFLKNYKPKGSIGKNP